MPEIQRWFQAVFFGTQKGRGRGCREIWGAAAPAPPGSVHIREQQRHCHTLSEPRPERLLVFLLVFHFTGRGGGGKEQDAQMIQFQHGQKGGEGQRCG